MAQEIINSNENIGIPHGVSLWFQRNFTGEFREVGDILVDGVSLAPEFLDFRSYRFSINAVRKRLLTEKNASITFTMREPNILNLQRALFAGDVSSSQSQTQYEGRHFPVRLDVNGTYIDLDNDASESGFGSITIKEIFSETDVLNLTNLIAADLLPDTDGKVYFDSSDTGLDEGDQVYVQYEKALSGLYKAEIFGSSTASVEGAAQLQVLNPQGGVLQIWALASVSLAPNGDLTYAIDDVQNIPMTATLQERSGTFGNIFTA